MANYQLKSIVTYQRPPETEDENLPLATPVGPFANWTPWILNPPFWDAKSQFLLVRFQSSFCWSHVTCLDVLPLQDLFGVASASSPPTFGQVHAGGWGEIWAGLDGTFPWYLAEVCLKLVGCWTLIRVSIFPLLENNSTSLKLIVHLICEAPWDSFPFDLILYSILIFRMLRFAFTLCWNTRFLFLEGFSQKSWGEKKSWKSTNITHFSTSNIIHICQNGCSWTGMVWARDGTRHVALLCWHVGVGFIETYLHLAAHSQGHFLQKNERPKDIYKLLEAIAAKIAGICGSFVWYKLV